jgi:hypothetical protein
MAGLCRAATPSVKVPVCHPGASEQFVAAADSFVVSLIWRVLSATVHPSANRRVMRF